ncbi:hypothetical protein Tco_0216267 [Tanacetum coccineum]
MTQLKKLTFDELKTEFEKLVKSIENLVPMEADERVKRQGVQLEQEFSKKQKIKDVPEEKKYGKNRPEEMYDRVLWGDLKTMFDPPLSDDAIWSLPIHCLTLDASSIYMLADRKYPLSKDACQVMLKMKLLDGTKDEVCYQLLKMIEKQEGIR